MIYIVLQFIPQSSLNSKGNGRIPIEVSGVRCRGSGIQKFRIFEVQGFRGSGFNGSGFKKKIHSDNPERVIPPGRETFEPISL
jgi:hypothetical protein